MTQLPEDALSSGLKSITIEDDLNDSSLKPFNLARETLFRMLEWLKNPECPYHSQYAGYIREVPNLFKLLLNCPPDNIWNNFENLRSLADLGLERYARAMNISR
jgi:hypothetical protein